MTIADEDEIRFGASRIWTMRVVSPVEFSARTA